MQAKTWWDKVERVTGIFHFPWLLSFSLPSLFLNNGCYKDEESEVTTSSALLLSRSPARKWDDLEKSSKENLKARSAWGREIAIPSTAYSSHSSRQRQGSLFQRGWSDWSFESLFNTWLLSEFLLSFLFFFQKGTRNFTRGDAQSCARTQVS